MSERPPIEVVADWQGLETPLSVGWLHRDEVRGDEVLAFEYTDLIVMPQEAEFTLLLQ
jgi:hypothetical protein